MKYRYRIPPDKHQIGLPFASVDPFGKWADRYFKKRMDEFVPVTIAFNDCIAFTQLPITRLQFRKALTTWAHARGFELDPVEVRNKGNRVIRKHEVMHGTWKAMEMIYLKDNANGEH